MRRGVTSCLPTIRELAAFALHNDVDGGHYAALHQQLSSAVHKPELGNWRIPFCLCGGDHEGVRG